MKTTGPVSQLSLSVDRRTIKSDGKDLAFVTISLTDRAGLVVPRSKNRIRLKITGPGEIVAFDNGDATSHESFQAKERAAYNGLALVIVRTIKGKPGPIVLRAESDGLTAGNVSLRSGR